MKLEYLIEGIEEVYPSYLQYEWDNSGLNVGYKAQDVRKVMTTLEVTSSVIDEAIEQNVDLIISHHPFLFSKINSITDMDNKGILLIKLIKNNISIYCMHTCYDLAFEGLNDYFLRILGIENCGVFDKVGSNESYCNGKEYGLGRIGKLKEKTILKDFALGIKEQLGIDGGRIVGNPYAEISKIAVVTGSGAEYFEMAKNMDIDLLITGDVKYHQAVDSYELGVNVLDLGHFGTEHIFSEAMKIFLCDKFGSIEVVISKKQSDPFLYL